MLWLIFIWSHMIAWHAVSSLLQCNNYQLVPSTWLNMSIMLWFHGKPIFAAYMFMTANNIVNGLDQPDEPQAINASEGPNPTPTEEAGGLGSETWAELAVTAQFLWRSKWHIVGCATEVSIQVIQLVWIVNTTIPERLDLETMFLVLVR